MKKKPKRQPEPISFSLGRLLREVDADKVFCSCQRNGAGQLWAHFALKLPGGELEHVGSINLEHAEAH